jgi:hypothetical protein
MTLRFSSFAPLALSVLALAGWSSRRGEPIKFARTAHVSSQGLIAFTYQDDIWLAKRDGRSRAV